jgi:hypothetical protein
LHAKIISPIEIHHQSEEVYGEKCMDVKNVRKWGREFSVGRLSVHDMERSGKPSHTDETVQNVEELVLEDRRSTLNELAEKLQEVCSRNFIHSILVLLRINLRSSSTSSSTFRTVRVLRPAAALLVVDA